MFLRSPIREIKPLTWEYCPRSSMSKLVGGVIVRSFSRSCKLLKANALRPSWLYFSPVDHGIVSLRPSLRVSTRYLMRFLILHILVRVGPFSYPFLLCMVSKKTLIHTSLMVRPPPSFQLEEAGELISFAKAFSGTHPSSIGLRRLSLMITTSVQVLSLTTMKTTLQFDFHCDVSTNLNLNNLLDPQIMLCYHHVLTHYGTGPKYYFLGDTLHSREILLVHFMSGGLKYLFLRHPASI
ncbi:hypothetical protein Cgig2_020378 [Carnegiea gigantea]|uniref:Uncharacterized protein n=1 Tax=Carnegiea gigantea TaxID=171969 RepID=A0A9Q1Q4G1_9CARY|nr:hypothetical protein Cgig2_020378 [Carnegiea gigantea]